MNDEQLKGVASRLKHVRVAELGLSLEEAAKKLGVNKSTMNRCETGKQIPDIKYIFQFEEFSGRSAAWILTGIEVDETAITLKEQNYLILVDAITTLLARTLKFKKVQLRWEYYGKVVKMLFHMSLNLVHEGVININMSNEDWLLEDLSHELQSNIDDLFYMIKEDMFIKLPRVNSRSKYGLYYFEVNNSDMSSEPLVRSKPVYPSHEAAEADTVKKFSEAFKGQPISKARTNKSNFM